MKFKTLSVLVTAALLAGCGGSSSGGKQGEANKINFTTEREAFVPAPLIEEGKAPVEYYQICKVPNLEVLIHSLDGELVDTVTTDENGQLALSEIPNNHYFTVNPYQEGFSEQGINIESIQKELVKAGQAVDVSYYLGETVDCETYEEESDWQLLTIETDLDGIETLPSSWFNNGAMEIELDDKAPGIFAFNEDFTEYAFISREEFGTEGTIVVTGDMFKPFENLKSLDVAARYSFTMPMWVVDGYNFGEGPEFVNEEPESLPLELPQNIDQLKVVSISAEHIELNGFAYASMGNHSTDRDIRVEAIPADSFVMGDFDGQTLNFELNGFSAHLAITEKTVYEGANDFEASHVAMTLNPSNSITMPNILKQPKVAELAVTESAMLVELDNPSDIDFDSIDALSGKFIVPVSFDFDLPERLGLPAMPKQ